MKAGQYTEWAGEFINLKPLKNGGSCERAVKGVIFGLI
ncbi:hypothetical protein GACE_2258 [Geoglobus acetivorans]|uniref:Uncharacterized protein n=1 Tax=Geoglobus acetivorans TaxID=565033 RepID=A0A0A7GGX2_GEOAI|nr:hypothetical protein GACE_2258 [Geoglobus acetivorans]